MAELKEDQWAGECDVLVCIGDMPWIPTGPGKAFKPLRFERHWWSELMLVEPGAAVARHRHTGAVSAYQLSGDRRFTGGTMIRPGDYHYEPPGLIDAWEATGTDPCVIHLRIDGGRGISGPRGARRCRGEFGIAGCGLPQLVHRAGSRAD